MSDPNHRRGLVFYFSVIGVIFGLCGASLLVMFYIPWLNPGLHRAQHGDRVLPLPVMIIGTIIALSMMGVSVWAGRAVSRLTPTDHDKATVVPRWQVIAKWILLAFILWAFFFGTISG